ASGAPAVGGETGKPVRTLSRSNSGAAPATVGEGKSQQATMLRHGKARLSEYLFQLTSPKTGLSHSKAVRRALGGWECARSSVLFRCPSVVVDIRSCGLARRRSEKRESEACLQPGRLCAAGRLFLPHPRCPGRAPEPERDRSDRHPYRAI